MSMGHPITIAIVGLVGLMGLSGCLSGPAMDPHSQEGLDRSETEPSIGPMPLAGAIIYSDTDDSVRIDGRFYSDALHLEYCSDPFVHSRGVLYIVNVYDRYGLVDQVYRNFTWVANGTWSFDVPLTGSYPHLIIGDTSRCIVGSKLYGIDAGQAEPVKNNDNLLSTADFDEIRQKVINISMTVPISERSLHTEWIPSEFAWRVYLPFLKIQSGQTPGTLEFVTSAGHVARSFDVDWLGRWTDNPAGPAFLYPGAYALNLELDQPAVTPTEWIFQVAVDEFDSRICKKADLEWSICEE